MPRQGVVAIIVDVVVMEVAEVPAVVEVVAPHRDEYAVGLVSFRLHELQDVVAMLVQAALVLLAAFFVVS